MSAVSETAFSSLAAGRGAPRKIPVRQVLRGLLGGVLGVLAFGAWAGWHVQRTAAPFLYQRLQDVPERPVGIVFGARVYPDGSLSPVLRERVAAGIALYRAGKVRKLLMTGDNGRRSYDEVTAMKRYAVERGVPARDVVRDFAGFRTYDSCYRARAVFGVDSAVLVTQEFHLPRAVYLARRLGIEAVGYVSASGLDARGLAAQERRELIARPSAVLDVDVLRRRPRFLGPAEPLFQDERDDR